MSRISSIVASMLVVVGCCWTAFGEEKGLEAKITRIDGSAELLRRGTEQWRPARINMPLQIGDQLYSRAESMVEITYAHGEILRMDEETKIVIEEIAEKIAKTRTSLGNVWVNMRKLASSGQEFEVTSPTAVAAIRGTIFQMSTREDSSTSVSVFDGKVAVGPSDQLKQKLNESSKQKNMDQPVEVPGPQEIPGPFEVPLEQWKTIVAGQRISVRADGKFASEKFDHKKVSDEFMKINVALDKALMKQ